MPNTCASTVASILYNKVDPPLVNVGLWVAFLQHFFALLLSILGRDAFTTCRLLISPRRYGCARANDFPSDWLQTHILFFFLAVGIIPRSVSSFLPQSEAWLVPEFMQDMYLGTVERLAEVSSQAQPRRRVRPRPRLLRSLGMSSWPNCGAWNSSHRRRHAGVRKHAGFSGNGDRLLQLLQLLLLLINVTNDPPN